MLQEKKAEHYYSKVLKLILGEMFLYLGHPSLFFGQQPYNSMFHKIPSPTSYTIFEPECRAPQ